MTDFCFCCSLYSSVLVTFFTLLTLLTVASSEIFLLIAFIGGGIVQYGDNVRKMTFTKEELAFMQENKKFSSFTDGDIELYYRSLMTFQNSKPETYEKYYNQFLEWKTDQFMEMNKHRELSREEAKGFVEKDMKSRRKSK